MLMLGCAEVELGGDEGALAGTPTTARPEVGRYLDGTATPCMAVLVAPQVALTSAACLNWTNTSAAVPAGAAFSFTDAGGTLRAVGIDKAHGFARTFREVVAGGEYLSELAALHLVTPVPASQATPAALAARPPAEGDAASVFGWDEYESLGKQVRAFTYDAGDAPFEWDWVDRGGAAVAGGTTGGDLWGVAARVGHRDGSVMSDFAPVPFYAKQLEDLMHRWNGPDEVGFDRGGNDYTSATTSTVAACRALCESAGACRAFTWNHTTLKCWLKKGASDPRPSAQGVSGLPARLELATDRPGGDYATLSFARAEQCAAACARDGACKAWTFVNGGACWLKSTVPAAVPSTCCTAGVMRGLETDVNRAGADYAVVTTPTYEGCASACAKDARCKAFTLVAAGTQCWLKAWVPGTSVAPGMTSGVKRGVEVNQNRGGSDYRSFGNPAADPFVCQAACAAEGQCQAWTYDGRTGQTPRCHLKSGIPVATSMLGVVSGIKGFEMM